MFLTSLLLNYFSVTWRLCTFTMTFSKLCEQENEENGEPEIDDEEDDEVDEEDEEEGEGRCNTDVHIFQT